MPEGGYIPGPMAGLSTGMPWRQNFGAPPVTPGEPIGMGGTMAAIQQALQMQQALGEQGGANVMSGARSGKDPKLKQQVEGITGVQDATQNQLAAMARFPHGQFLADTFGPAMGTAMNALYTGDKALSQALGRSKMFLPTQYQQMDATTSDASLGNFLTAQAGIASRDPIGKFILGLLTGQGGQK